MAKMIAKFMLKDYRPHDDAVAWFDVVDEDGNVESYGITDGSVTGERMLLDGDGICIATLDADGWIDHAAQQRRPRRRPSHPRLPRPLLASSICSNGGRSRDLPASRA